MALPKYNHESPCPKCGANASSVKAKFQKGASTVFGDPVDVMHRSCDNCGAEWDEAPLDTPAPE